MASSLPIVSSLGPSAALTRPSLAARVYRDVDTSGTGCWEWTGARLQDGYGRFRHQGGHYLPHRVVLMVAIGRVLEPGEVSRHRCDNPPCVNPAHLEPGTHADNARDMVSRGRSAAGEDHGMAVLTAELVAQARRRVRAGASVASVARDLSAALPTLQDAVRGRNWPGVVNGEPPVDSGRPPRQRLTPELVAQARKRVRAGSSLASVARDLSVSRSTIQAAVRGRTWPGPVLGQAPVPEWTKKSRPESKLQTAIPNVTSPERTHP